MMKWRARKTSSTSSSASAFSWLSKFKQMTLNSEANHGKMKKQKEAIQQNSTSVSSPKYSCENGNRDALWRPSFIEETQEDKKSGEKIDENVIPPSNGRKDAKKHGTRKNNLKVKEKKDSDLGDERKLVDERKFPLEKIDDDYNREKEYELLRRRFERKAQSVLQEQLLKLEREASEKVEFASSKAVEEDGVQFDSPRTICTPRTHSFASFADSKNPNIRTIVESCEKTGNLGLKVKTKKKRRTTHDDGSREMQRRKPKVRINSPRMASRVESCKVKAIEDMRKSKLKMKKTERDEEEILEEEAEGSSDSFAVIKCSLDPKRDFRESMIEMITEKQIRYPEEMEELLACYLTLNADEYHDLIIKVFRQVWFDMNQGGLGITSDTMQCCCCE